MPTVKAAVFYFTLTFSAGFVLGPLRVFFVAPWLGTRWAEITETPIMLLVCFLAARWSIRRFEVATEITQRLAMGGLALLLMLAAEFYLVLQLRGLSINEYLATRDPVSGSVYYGSLLVFAALPSLVERDTRPQRHKR